MAACAKAFEYVSGSLAFVAARERFEDTCGN
jgi:hypothetical protein